VRFRKVLMLLSTVECDFSQPPIGKRHTTAAAGPQAYTTVQVFTASWVGRILLFGCTFSFFLHLCGSIRHLIWDAGYGFELRTIYASGWTVVLVSSALTLLSWIISMVLLG
jgi:succinate dehydrogenase / fumarate reductase cytochrome b subunit